MRSVTTPWLPFVLALPLGCAPASPPVAPPGPDAPAVPVIETTEATPLPFATYELSPKMRWVATEVRGLRARTIPDEVLLEALPAVLRADVARAFAAPADLAKAQRAVNRLGAALLDCEMSSAMEGEGAPEPCAAEEERRLQQDQDRAVEGLHRAEEALAQASERARSALAAAARRGDHPGVVALARAQLAARPDGASLAAPRDYGAKQESHGQPSALRVLVAFYEEAERHLSADRPLGAWARYRHALVLDALGDDEGALSRLRVLVDRQGKAPEALQRERAVMRLWLASIHARRGDDGAAVEALERVREEAPPDRSAALEARRLLPLARYRAGDLDGALQAAIDELDHVDPMPQRDLARNAGLLGMLALSSEGLGVTERVAADVLQRRGWASLPARTTPSTKRRLALAMALRAMDLGRPDAARGFLAEMRGEKRWEAVVAVLESVLEGEEPSEDERKRVEQAVESRSALGLIGPRRLTFEDQVTEGALDGEADMDRRVDRLTRLCLEPLGPRLGRADEASTDLVLTVESARHEDGEPWRVRTTAEGGEVPAAFASCVEELAPDWLFGAEGSVRLVARMDAIDELLPMREGASPFGTLGGMDAFGTGGLGIGGGLGGLGTKGTGVGGGGRGTGGTASGMGLGGLGTRGIGKGGGGRGRGGGAGRGPFPGKAGKGGRPSKPKKPKPAP